METENVSHVARVVALQPNLILQQQLNGSFEHMLCLHRNQFEIGIHLQCLKWQAFIYILRIAALLYYKY